MILSLIIVCNVNATENTDSDSKSNLFGTWICEYKFGDSGSQLKFASEDTYVRNGTTYSIGSFGLKITEDVPEITYSLSASGTWEIVDGYLITTSSEIKLVNLTNPEIDDILPLKEMFPQNVSESAKILEINESQMALKSETDGQIYLCTKKKI